MSNRLDDFEDPFKQLSHNVKFWLDAIVPHINKPSSIEFLRNFVMKNKPCVIRGAIDHWPAMFKWTDDYLCRAMNNIKVSIAATPNGRADDVCEGSDGKDRFVLPETRKLLFSEFLGALGDEKSDDILYCQSQNNSMVSEFYPLLGDIEQQLLFASEAFGMQPDAVNFWMGEDRSVSSLHQDPYENMYCVLRGEKHFTLLPPTAEPWITKPQFRQAHWEKLSNGWEIVDDDEENKVPWVTTDPNDIEMSPPIKVVVKKGETLYLPALWYHQVSQRGEEGRTVAVNFWYDMCFDNLSFTLLEFLKTVSRKRDSVDWT